MLNCCNRELYDLRIIICLRKSIVTDERISVYNVIGKIMEHGLKTPTPMVSQICYCSSYDVISISK